MEARMKSFKFILTVVASFFLASCGSYQAPGSSSTSITYTIGGTISGLSGTGLVLQDNGGNNLPVSANGSFAFTTAIASGSAYSVTVLTQPSSPAQTCVVTSGSGAASTNITSVQVTCTITVTYTIGGTISGLSGTGLVLQDNGGNNLAVSANGSFTFTTAIASGGAYSVTVLTQPSSPTQTCVVTSGSGAASANITSVQVACTTNTYTIGGTVSGLSGTGLVLQDNGGNNLSVSANGSFTFTTAIASGGAYIVTVLTQPSSPTQTCVVTSGSGAVTSANITSVQVNCTTAPFASIQINPASGALNPTQTVQLTATALDSGGNPVSGVQFTWNSSAPTVATISNAGLATGVAIGTSNVTASSSGITSQAAPLMVVSVGSLFTPDDNLTKASVANGPTGDVDFVWSGPNSSLSSGVGIFFGRSIDGGNSFPTLVSVPNSDSGGQPAVAVAPNNNVYVFWNSSAATTPLFANIAMSTTTDGGTTFSAPVNVTNHLQTTYGIGASAQEDPKVYVDSAGNIDVVTTLSRSLSDANFDVIYSRSINGGGSFTGPTLVFNNFALPTGNSAFGPAVLSSGNNVYVAWGESPSSGSSVVEFSHSTDAGSTFSAPLTLGNQDGGCSANSCVSLGIDSNGVITAVWGGGAAPGLFFARSTDGGTTFSARVQIPNTKFADLNPYSVVDASGTVYVVWERIPPAATGIQADIYFSRSSDGGATWSFPVDISSTPSNDSRTANMAVDTNHNINLVWMEFVTATFPTPQVAYRRAK
jgi:hypothetical protein